MAGIFLPGNAKGSSGDITGVTAGTGLSGGGSSGGVTLTLDLSELSAVTPVNGDSLATLDSDGANEQLTTVAALATLFSGDGLAASSSVMGVDLVSNGGLEISSNKLQVATGISQYDVAQFAASVVDNDFLRIDGTAVEGLSAAEVAAAIESSIDAVGTIATGTWEGTTIAVDQGGTGATSLNNLITLSTHTTGNYVATITGGTGITSTGATSGEGITHTLALDLNELTGATLADGDSLVFIDANDSNGSRKEALADVLDLIAGTVATTGLDRSGATLVVTDLHPVGVSGANNQLITDDGDGTVTSESNLTFTGSVLTVTGSVDTTLDQHFDSSPSDETVSGITATFTAGEDLERGEVVYFKASDSKMWKAVASATGTMPVVAMAAADISADATGKFLLYGFLADNGTFPAYTVGGTLYAPEAETSSQNVPEQAAPDTDGDFVQVLGYAVTANSVFFNPSNDVIEHD